MAYLVVKWLHVLSSTVLFGTGLGSAYYMFCASRTRDARVIAVVARQVVIADWLFTTPAIILQPVTGFLMVHQVGYPWSTPWISWSLGLYLLAGAAWLPVVWMQIRMRDMAAAAARDATPLPAGYWQYLRAWTSLGVLAFLAVIAIFYLMVVKPGI